ncbi:MAG: c-type cytochrome [Zoogloeaceae bacterium]|nr:c-type cytochrome [Zoogloeaceae bacterium]
MPVRIRPPFCSFRPPALSALLLAAMTAGCSQPDTSDPKIAERIAPVARFELGAPAATASEAAPHETEGTAAPEGKDGATVYAQLCKTCHDIGLSGAPKLGDHAAWAPRIATGMDALYQSSLNGKNVMPPKGGNTSLSDEEVKSAVDFMVAASQ